MENRRIESMEIKETGNNKNDLRIKQADIHLKNIINIVKQVSIEGEFLGREKHIVRKEHLTKTLVILGYWKREAESKCGIDESSGQSGSKTVLEEIWKKSSKEIDLCNNAARWAKYCVDGAESDLSEIGSDKGFQACAEVIVVVMNRANKLTGKDFEDIENEGIESIKKSIEILKDNSERYMKNIREEPYEFILNENTEVFNAITENNSDMIEKFGKECECAIEFLQNDVQHYFDSIALNDYASEHIRNFWNKLGKDLLGKDLLEQDLLEQEEDEDGRYYAVKAVLEVVRRRKKSEEKKSLDVSLSEKLEPQVFLDSKSQPSSQTYILGSLGGAFHSLLGLARSPKEGSKSLDEINMIGKNSDKENKSLEENKILDESGYNDKNKALEPTFRSLGPTFRSLESRFLDMNTCFFCLFCEMVILAKKRHARRNGRKNRCYSKGSPNTRDTQ